MPVTRDRLIAPNTVARRPLRSGEESQWHGNRAQAGFANTQM